MDFQIIEAFVPAISVSAGIFGGFESGLVERHAGAIGGDFIEMYDDLSGSEGVDCIEPELTHDDETGLIQDEDLAGFFKDF